MTRSIFLSLIFHSAMIVITAITLPFMKRVPIDLPPIISVDLIQIADKTNIPFAAKAAKTLEKIKKINSLLCLKTRQFEKDLYRIKSSDREFARKVYKIRGLVQLDSQTFQVKIDKIVPKILAISNNRTDTRIYVRGDKTINYGRVLEIMGMLSGSGFSKVALISEPYKN